MPVLHRLLTLTCFALMAVVLIACGSRSNSTAPILLFNGTGTSANDVAAVETILADNHLNYTTINSAGLNAMTPARLNHHRLLIVPGGNFIGMGNSLTTTTAANIHQAVQHGLNYMGICAGGFLAGKSVYYHGFDLAGGVRFGFYAPETKGIHKAAVAITDTAGKTLDQYWEDGPQLSGWGRVVAKYSDGTPAVTTGKCGRGFIILTGIHAEAPASWRRGMVFTTPVSADSAYAASLIRAALRGTM